MSPAVVGARESWHDALAPFELARDSDLATACSALGTVFDYDGVIAPIETEGGNGNTVVRAVELSRMSLGYLRFGGTMRVYTAPASFYHVNIALGGELVSYFGSQRVVARPGMAALNAVGQAQRIPIWDADVEMLFVSIPRASFESELGSLLGRPVAKPGSLVPQLDLAEPLGRSWFALLELLLTELAENDSMTRVSRRHREEIERLLLRGLIRAASHDLSSEVRSDSAPARWRSIKRVIEAVEAEPERAWNLAELARIAEVSGRRLQQGFQAQLGATPLGYVHEVRLQRAHRDLLANGGRVVDVSTRWGFAHPGRFAASYRMRFGERPSETLTRSRAAAL